MAKITGEGFTAIAEKGKLTIEIDLTKAGTTSASGKSTVLASSRGAVSIATDKGDVKLNLNLYIPR